MGETVIYWSYNLAWKIIRWIPESRAYSLANRFADFLYARNGKGVNRLRSNYRRVRPELDGAQLEFLVNAGMRSYLRYWCDTFRLPDWSKDCKDIDDAVARYGRLYTLHSIVAAAEESPLKIKLRAKKWFT